MSSPHQELLDAVSGARGPAASDALCRVCTLHLDADGAALAVVLSGVHLATLGASDQGAGSADEVHVTVGEGPALDAVASARPVQVPLVDAGIATKWPAFCSVLESTRVRAVFAFPVFVHRRTVAALTLFWDTPGGLSRLDHRLALEAARLAALPVLDLAALGAGGQPAPDDAPWSALGSATRIEVAQATGVLMEGRGVDSGRALLRLRAHAFATGRSLTDVASEVVARRLSLDGDTAAGDARTTAQSRPA